MIPRTVLMAKEIENLLTAPQLAQYGNIIGAFYRGWSTNYYEYYTQLQPNGYGVNPGDPTMFKYSVHSFTPFTGPIVSLGGIVDGTGYTPGTYTGVATTTSGSGTGATLDVTVAADGTISSWALNAPGDGYAYGDSVVPTGIGPGVGFEPLVTAVVPGPGGAPKWAQAPRRFNQNQVSTFTPPNINQQAIQYSFMYPVADRVTPPPIGYV